MMGFNQDGYATWSSYITVEFLGSDEPRWFRRVTSLLLFRTVTVREKQQFGQFLYGCTERLRTYGMGKATIFA